MINYIKISNFKSIHNEVTLNFDDQLIFNMLFGKVGSGKSLVFETIKQFKEVFLYGMRSVERIPDEIKTTYTIEFMIDNQMIHYHTTLNYDKSEILYEALEQVTKTSKYVYFIRDGYDITIGDKLERIFTPFDFERFKTYLYDLRFDKREFILNHLRLKDFSESKGALILSKLADYIHKLKFLRPDNHINFYTDMDESHYVSVLKLVQSVLPQIHSLQYKEVSLDDLRYRLNRHRYDHLLDEFRNHVTKFNASNFFIEVYDEFYKLSGRNLNELSIHAIDVHYNDGKILNFSDLSKGEKAILVLSMMISNAKINDYIFIDDVTSHIDHASFTRWLKKVRPILSLKHIKLNCTTHDMLLFDSRHFDFKEMIYVSKNPFSKLNYLSALGIRKDKKILNLYLEGYFDKL